MDLLARGLAASVRDTTPPQLRRFADLSSLVVPAACSAIEAGSDATRGTYVADALATAELAAANPRCCKADASGRYFRLLPVNGAIDMVTTGLTTTGNQTPAVQAAVNYAIAIRAPRVVNSLGAVTFAMWIPMRTSAYGGEVDGIPLYVTGAKSLEIDFAGATIFRQGVTGGNPILGQTSGALVPGYNWIGGWLYVVGPMDRFVLRNVTVDGQFAGNVTTNADSNVTDKGFRVQDTTLGYCELENVELRNFAGEIYYHAAYGPGSHDAMLNVQVLTNCHFHGSAQSAYNPNSRGRIHATNVMAGRAYAAAEVIGGPGHTYIGCRFYDSYTSLFHGGPDPDVLSGYHYATPVRRTDAVPPFLHFHDTRFERCAPTFTGWARGRVVVIDCGVTLGTGYGDSDIDLEVEAWCDRNTNFEAVALAGPANLTTQVAGSPTGTYIVPPHNIDVRVNCRRTRLAQDNARRHSAAVRLYAGLYDKDTIRFRIDGEATYVWDILGTPPAGFGIPLMIEGDFRALGQPGGGPGEYVAADTIYTPAWPCMAAYMNGTGTFNITLATTYGYAEGQLVTILYWAGATNQILAFAKNGAGMRLNADRTARRPGEHLTVRWSVLAGKWLEHHVVDQGA
ncbi:MAG: hypothetical protein ABIP41_05650 [Croceibacterium sp.]